MLLPEDNFKDTSLNGMALKSLVRGYSFEADELIDWVEQGLFDALEKQYVSVVVTMHVILRIRSWLGSYEQ